jgi:hypothetical protein
VAGGKDPLTPRLPSNPRGESELEPLSPFTEESTALHSTEDLDAMLRKAEAATAEPAREPQPGGFADDEHTMIGSAQELEALALKAAPEPEPPKSAANTVRRRTNPMGVVHVTGQMQTVRPSGSISIPTAPAPAPPPSRAPAPATQSDDDLFEAAFADSSLGAPEPVPLPAVAPSPSRSHEPTPAPPFKPAAIAHPPQRTREPTPGPPGRRGFRTAPGIEVEDAQRVFETNPARPPTPASRRGLAIVSAIAALLLVTLIVSGVRSYNAISAAQDETQNAEREVIRARADAAEVALQLANAKAKIEALKSTNAALERKLAAQTRAETERSQLVEPPSKPRKN